MSKDGTVEAFCNNNDSEKNSNGVALESSTCLQSQLSGDCSLAIISRDKSKTYNKGDNNEVDYSFGTNLRKPQHMQTPPTSDYIDDGNMDVQTQEPALKECAAEPVNDTNVESFVGSSEERAHSSLKEDVGLKFISEKKQSSANNVIECESVNSSDPLKSMKPVKSCTSGCRSSIQDHHDSCLRMDALPNVSPDSGIISIEGSPFGNESPHSAGGGEIRQETNPSLVAGKSKKIHEEVNDSKHEDVVLKEQLSPTHASCKGDVSNDEIDDIHSMHLEMKASDSNISDEYVNKSHDDENVLERQPCIGNDDKEIHVAEEIKSGIEDFTPSLPAKINPHNGEQIESDCDQTYNDPHMQQSSDVVYSGENILEGQMRKSEEKLNSLHNVRDNVSSGVPAGNDSLVKKKSVGRPRGSVNKKFAHDPPRRTYRKSVPKAKKHEYSEIPVKPVKPSSFSDGEKIKRGRGRPRKYFYTEEEPSTLKVTQGKKKKTRKRVFTRAKKTNVNKMTPQHSCNESFENVHDESTKTLEFSEQHSPLNSFLKSGFDSLSSKSGFVTKNSMEMSNVNHVTSENSLEKSDFSSKDLEVILKSVKSSISSQFTSEKDDENNSSLHFDNPFKFAKSPFPQLAHPAEKSPIKPKPKYKKPKLHVMMRKTKRKKRKKFESSRLGGFGASSPQRRLSFFTSRMQPSKILASSRLNVFQTGTGVETNRPETPTDGEQTEGSEKRMKKRRKLLSFKSKHKNITDPALAADLGVLEDGLKNMMISENAADNFIKVRPGEMPLPSIFRVRKIEVMKKAKEKMMEFSNFETSKMVKSVRKEIASPAASSSSIKNVSKCQRKKNSPEEASSYKDQTSLSDSSDQWLPPKKRHRMVHGESMIPQTIPTECMTSGNALKESCHGDGKRKGRRQRKAEGDGSVNTLLSHPNVDQVLTIDTSSYSTAGSSVSTLTPSPCPSRHSTRSSTFTSISSLSPAECNLVHGRHVSKMSGSLTCPNHSLGASSFQNDFMSCAECQLLRRSTTTTTRTSNIIRSNSPFIQSSNQSFGFNTTFDNQTSSSECSPVLKTSAVPKEQNRRYPQKRRKLSNSANKEIELSPPRLEKHNLLTSSIFSPELSAAPTEIFPQKRNPSPYGRSALKRSGNSIRPSVSYYTANKSVERSSHRSCEQPSPSSIVSDAPLCNTPVNLSHLSASPSVIPVLSDSDRQPLPLEHCKKKDVVVKIQTALQFDSSDNSSSDEEKDGNQYPSNPNHKPTSSGQPPRKRYQRVGLFSDFYKDNEPRKRCENMVRCREKLVYVKDEHEYGLMPFPIHIGFHYMTQIQDFQLPYDIWWQDYHNQLPKKSEAKSKFRTIRSNIYVDGKANCRKKEIPACSCRHSASGGVGCQDDCLNRMIYTECSMLNCPLGECCGNQRIQKHEWAPGIEKFLTEDRGIGVQVTKPVKSGQFILEYLGEVISETEFRRRMMEEYSEECHHYALHLDSGNVIDGYRMGNIGRYVNHSCQPNCEMQKWNVNGLYRMVLVAQRDIGAFEELGYDYNFDAFNQETQQECRCGNPECRGVIGGKGQRSNGVSKHEKADDTKDKRKSKLLNKKNRDGKCLVENIPVLPPMTNKERWFARKHSIFLVRNVDKVLNQRHPGQLFSPMTKEEMYVGKINCVTSDVLLSNLTESSVKTRLASFAKDNPEILRRHQLAQLFDKVLTELLSLKDQDGNSMVLPLMSLPSRKKQPQYYQVVKEPIDLSVIKQRVKTGHYSHLKPFNADLMLLFKNVELYCGPRSDIGQVVIKLRQILLCTMQELSAQINELLGSGTTKLCMDSNLEIMDERGAKDKQEPEEDIIRCICGVTRDEGLMLQCEKCMRWQHCDCVGASGKEEHYLCDRCEPRYYDPEILLAPPLPDSLPDCTHFMTLVKDDVQYAIGDCVYVMRDCKRSASGTPIRSSHRLIATSNPDSLDIFRIEQLWKDPKGERFASGTPYLRPQETFHEPTRKFLHNELFRTPNYEIIPIDLVMGKCVVMDPTTYCKGRPKGIKEQDVYVCEYRVDKTAHLFHKIKEIWYPMNTNRFCFDYFETKLILKRTFTPHEIPEEYRRKATRNSNSAKCGKTSKGLPVKEEKPDVKSSKTNNHPMMNSKVKIDESLKHDIKLKAEVKVNMNKGSDLNQDVKSEVCHDKSNVRKQLIEEKIQEKRHRLDRLCLKLLNNMPGKQKVDLSYLLDGGKRIRKKLLK